MKTPTKPTAPRMPRARVTTDYYLVAHSKLRTNVLHKYYTAVIPTATAQQARKLAAFFNLTEEERVETIAKEMNRRASSKEFGPFFMECDRKQARHMLAVLAAITGGRK